MAGGTATDLVGRVLAGRYRLLRSIGAGGSGQVYVADDVRLRRRVAVKVLHPALADDAGFLRRFRSEAQLAASLHHPNVMAVYDWGQDDGIPFMVLELLAGGSLRGMLDHGLLLSPSQAAHVGRQVCSALDYAHGRGLVHRDVKPANLLFDEHGIVRVADFGLARALAEASWTEPAGTVLGTARYAAPEQATGAPLDGRADLYALALVLVESVTGHVPFVADTPIGTLAARTRDAIRAPAELGPLGPVVERAGRTEPADRYPDALTMKSAIDDAIGRLPPPGPLTLAGLGQTIEDPNPTQLPQPRSDVFDQDADRRPIPTATAPVRRAAGGDFGRRALAPVVVAVIVLIALVGAVVAATSAAGGSGDGSLTVPNVVGATVTSAREAASRAGFTLSLSERTADDPRGTVIGQSPEPGGWLGRGDAVRVVVSKGPKPISLPGVKGKPEAEATKMLQDIGLVVTVQRRYDETVAKGTALTTSPARRALPDSTVALIVSDGPAPVKVPDVSAKTYDDAVAALKTVRFAATRVDEFNDTVPVGQVIRTDPPSGQKAPRDSTVTVFVSKGPDLVAVPKFTGLTIDQANQAAAAAGVQLQVSGIITPSSKVRAQDVAPGTQVKRGSVVAIFF